MKRLYEDITDIIRNCDRPITDESIISLYWYYCSIPFIDARHPEIWRFVNTPESSCARFFDLFKDAMQMYASACGLH